MTWADFYLICFAVGFLFSLLSFLAGGLRWHLHLPHFSHVHVAPPQSAAAHGAPANSLSAGPADGGKAVVHHPAAHLSPFNFVTLTAFLAWFGGTGYLLTRHSRLVGLLILGVSTVAGLIAGWSVFRFMVKLVSSDDLPMTNEERRIEGAIGTVSMPIREGGTGEIIFPIGGVRRCAGARAEDGKTIEKGAEVVIARYEKGIAYVRRWEEFTS